MSADQRVAEARQLLQEIQDSHGRSAVERAYRAERIERLRLIDEAEVADAVRIDSAQPD